MFKGKSVAAALGAAVIVAATMSAQAYDYASDPPAGTVSCNQKVTVKSSKHCGGKSATIIGGCNRQKDGRTGGGGPRRVVCK
jgi:hypothetical protein